ncbi:glycosyltransferase [Actinomyces lilanjuaniae]|uniref:Glycosyltransferase n=1 Tax=Actinomyces lilanjuaniae TaxID=2321394 RepID=A0ABM6Z2Y3_9ACTO|nr:glycosyltransferase family 4 protein [Actinomyces lilanjuaniae]AYD89636.1 glycosyltransferase [Actinomyces lilanjuaniae]
MSAQARGRRPHVLQVSGMAAGGVRAHLAQCARLLAADGCDVLVAAPAAVLEGLDTGRAHREVLGIGSRPSARVAGALVRLRRLARGAEVLHAHGLRAGALAAVAVGGRRVGRPRLVVTVHNLTVGGRLARLVGGGLEGLVAARADLVLAVSPDLAGRAQGRGAAAVELAVVPAPWAPRGGAETMAASGDVPEPASGSMSDAASDAVPSAVWAPGLRRVLTVARLAPQKGLDVLLDAAAVLGRRAAEGRLPTLEWVVVGDGPARAEAQQRIDAESLPVRLLGRREGAAALMAQAEVVVQTSLWEGQPLTLQEALRAGAAVVATDVGGTALTVRGGAVLVPPCSQEVAEAVGALLTSPDRLRQARERAHGAAASLPTDDDLLVQLHRALGV